MILDRVIAGSGCAVTSGSSLVEVSAVCNDSRKVCPGALFVAVKGFASDGHSFIATAVEKGASVIVYEDAEALKSQMPAIEGKEITLVKA